MNSTKNSTTNGKNCGSKVKKSSTAKRGASDCSNCGK